MREVLALDMRSEKGQHSHKYSQCAEYHGLSVTDSPVDDVCIPFRYRIQSLVDRRKEYLVELAVMPLVAEHS